MILTGDNFSLSPDASYTFRLLANGGPKNGFTSNEVLASLSGIDTRFAGWSLDENMFLTGIMAPNIGRGLEAGFTVRKLSDDSDVTGHLTYQWFKIIFLSEISLKQDRILDFVQHTPHFINNLAIIQQNSDLSSIF